MRFNLGTVVLMVTFLTHFDIISSTDGTDNEIVTGLLKLSRGERDKFGNGGGSSNQTDSSTGASSSSKRKRAGNSVRQESKKYYRKYHANTNPIDPRVDPNMVEKFALLEREFLSKGGILVWQNINELSEEDAIKICVDEWKMQVQKISELNVEDNMVADCSPYLVLGPSKPENSNYCSLKVQYAPEIINIIFFIDLLRCNCALLKKVRGKATRRVVKKSKWYFFLHRKMDTKQHFVFTTHDKSAKRIIQFVEAREISSY